MTKEQQIRLDKALEVLHALGRGERLNVHLEAGQLFQQADQSRSLKLGRDLGIKLTDWNKGEY